MIGLLGLNRSLAEIDKLFPGARIHGRLALLVAFALMIGLLGLNERVNNIKEDSYNIL